MKKIIETPLMKQYQEMKKKYPDAVLLFRIGDFYETFSDDAITASEILGITLTRRANGTDSYVELAGFPHHALDTYLQKLVRAGKRVAICEQIDDPRLTKTIKKREIEETATLNNKAKKIALIRAISSILAEFTVVINKLYTYEAIRAKSQEIFRLATMLNLPPKKVFEECCVPSQPTLFNL